MKLKKLIKRLQKDEVGLKLLSYMDEDGCFCPPAFVKDIEDVVGFAIAHEVFVGHTTTNWSSAYPSETDAQFHQIQTNLEQMERRVMEAWREVDNAWNEYGQKQLEDKKR